MIRLVMHPRSACLLLVWLVCARHTAAQRPDGARTSNVQEAAQLRDRGQFAAAARLLEARLKVATHDTAAEEMLAQTYYWMGDYTRAVRHFEAVLRASPGATEARRQLEEIRTATAPWVRLRAEHATDNQPLQRTTGEGEVGVYVTPAWSFFLHALPERFTSGDTSLTLLRADAGVRGYVPEARFDIELRAGITRGSATSYLTTVPRRTKFVADTLDFTGRARVALHAARGVIVSASIERGRYTYTVVSLVEPIMTTANRVAVAFDRSGWLGEAASQLELYPDDNSVRTGYAWLLMPLVRAPHALVQIGYGISYQDAEHTRFTWRNPIRSNPANPATLVGWYDPYFTPSREIIHSATGSFAVWNARGVRMQLNGSYGAYATRNAPVALNVPDNTRFGSHPETRFVAEAFHPFDAHAGIQLPLARNLSLNVDAERSRNAFYQLTRISAAAYYRFAPRPRT
jgi:hypothetical protein